MKAFVYEYGKLKLKEMSTPVAKVDEVVVKLKVSGLNRRDLYIPNRLGPDKEALILGSDGAGVIEHVGAEVKDINVGDEVIINPALRWEKNSDAPPAGFDILGMPDHGTFAERIVLAANQVEKKPAHLTWEQSGVLGLAALTAYRATFTKGQLQKGQTLFVPGVGSGVATFIVCYAKHIGARVIVTSRSEEKREHALKVLGVDKAIDTNGDWQEELKGETIDLVIDSVGEATFNRSLEVLKQGGKIVVFGATTDDTVQLNLREFFYGQYQLIGSTMGSREEFKAMLEFIATHGIYPEIAKSFPLEQAEAAFQMLDKSEQFGKIALLIEK
ncbi:zinc-binding dehydrogenase [Ornithinibacillus sp. 4-3]|uniref:Zinc-binding dehydrogenase n=1 Tax=Ornithinibacillus sp. 4-3 TaxID=3231488 RepID=A0AB39HUH4_9BACI